MMTKKRYAVAPCPTCASSTTDGMIAYHRHDFRLTPSLAAMVEWYKREDGPHAIFVACPDCTGKNVPEGYAEMTAEEVREWLAFSTRIS